MHDIDSMSVNIAISTMLSMKQDKKKIRCRPDVDERCDVDDVNKTEDPQCRQNVDSMMVNIAISTILIKHCVLDIPHKLHTFDRCYCNCYLGKLQVI